MDADQPGGSAGSTNGSADGSKGDLTAQVIEALPDWVSVMVQLNDLIAERMGLVVSDFQGLHALGQMGPATGRELAERVGLTAGSVTRMIDRLEGAGCVRRVPAPGDRRRTLIEPTQEGQDRVNAYYRGLTMRTQEDLSSFDEHELRALLRFIDASRVSTRAEVTELRADSVTT